MTLNFQMRREDVLAFTHAYHAASPTYQRMRTRVRYMLPLIMLLLWAVSLGSSGFEWIRTVIYLGVALLWYLLYPARFGKRVSRYAERIMDEGSHGKCLGPCELILAEDGLRSKSVTGQSTYLWSSVDRAQLNDTHLFIFLVGPIGYPIPLADVGADAAKAAYAFVSNHIAPTDKQNAAEPPPPATRL